MSYPQQVQNDALVSPRFYVEAVQDEKETKAKGRPIFKDVEMFEIKFAGDKGRVHVAPAHDKFKRDKATNEWLTYAEVYAPVYRRFKEGLAEQGSGTPLSELPFLTAAKRSELMALNVKTAEALAALDGQPLRNLGMGGRDLKNQAIAYLEKANGSADVTRMAAENEALKEQMAELQRQITEMQAAFKNPASSETLVEEDKAHGPSPFDDYSDDDIRNWLKDSGFAVDMRWGRKTLLQKADEANEDLKRRKDAA